MEYADKDILAKRELEKLSKYQTLKDGLYINGKLYSFEKKYLFHKISLYLASDFVEMPSEIVRVKYISEFRPQYIITNQDLEADYGFTMLWKDIDEEEIKFLAEDVQHSIKRANPEYHFFERKEIETIKGWYFAFRSQALDCDMYNMILYKKVGEHILQANFNCLYKNFIPWKKATLQMWSTIEEEVK